MTGDPDIHLAAVALQAGISDPLALLALSRGDLITAVAIVNEATKLRSEYDRSVADYTAAKTGHAILPGLVKNLSRMLSSLARSRG